jgi:hypothetical protein
VMNSYSKFRYSKLFNFTKIAFFWLLPLIRIFTFIFSLYFSFLSFLFFSFFYLSLSSFLTYFSLIIIIPFFFSLLFIYLLL